LAVPHQYEDASTVMVSRPDGRQDGKVMCAPSADDAEKMRLRRTQLHSTHPSSPQAPLAKGGVIEARLRSWMFDTAFQRLQIKTVCAVAPRECKLGGSTALCFEPPPTTNRGSTLSSPQPRFKSSS